MQVLNPKDDEMYGKLVRLAGGDSRIVMRVLSRQRPGPSVSLGTVVDEIVQIREQEPGPGQTGRRDQSAVHY